MAWIPIALAASTVGVVVARPSMTVGEAIQSGRITEAEAMAYLDRTAARFDEKQWINEEKQI